MIKESLKTYLFQKKKIDCDICSARFISKEIQKIGTEPARIRDCCLSIHSIGEGSVIKHVYGYGKIEIGRYVSITGPGTILHAEKGAIKIGSFTSIAENVSIQEFNHVTGRPSTSSRLYSIFGEPPQIGFVSKGDITIEEDVWIGSNAIILSGVTIGRGSIIGAGSVVTKEIPRYSIVVGNPGTVIRKRFSEETIRELEESRWWTWDTAKIRSEYAFFHESRDGIPSID